MTTFTKMYWFDYDGTRPCSSFFENELNRAGVEIVRGVKKISKWDPDTDIGGRLGTFSFNRSETSWVVQGRLPYRIMEELLRDVHGKRHIKIHKMENGVLSPGWIKWYKEDGTRVMSLACKKIR